MDFTKCTSNIVELFNSVFDELDVPPLFKNSNVVIDDESKRASYLTFAFYRDDIETIPLKVFIEGDSIRLDVFDLPETFEWSKEMIDHSQRLFIDFFKLILTNYVLLEICGNQYTKSRIYLFDRDGNLSEKYVLRGLFPKFSGWDCDKKLFFPIF